MSLPIASINTYGTVCSVCRAPMDLYKVWKIRQHVKIRTVSEKNGG